MRFDRKHFNIDSWYNNTLQIFSVFEVEVLKIAIAIIQKFLIETFK